MPHFIPLKELFHALFAEPMVAWEDHQLCNFNSTLILVVGTQIDCKDVCSGSGACSIENSSNDALEFISN
jgi:hypothetical protein